MTLSYWFESPNKFVLKIVEKVKKKKRKNHSHKPLHKLHLKLEYLKKNKRFFNKTKNQLEKDFSYFVCSTARQ